MTESNSAKGTFLPASSYTGKNPFPVILQIKTQNTCFCFKTYFFDPYSSNDIFIDRSYTRMVSLLFNVSCINNECTFLVELGYMMNFIQVLAFIKKLDTCADASGDFVSPGTSKARLDKIEGTECICSNFEGGPIVNSYAMATYI